MALTKKTIKILNECAEEYFFENDGQDFWVHLNQGVENTYEEGASTAHLETKEYDKPLKAKEIEEFVMYEICDCR